MGTMRRFNTSIFVAACLSVAVPAASLAAPGVAAAQSNDVAARRAFRLGQTYYENGQFGEAGRHFEEAYQLSGRAPLLYNAYIAYRDGQDLENAGRTLRMFLENANDQELDRDERDQLTARLAAIDAALGHRAGSVQEPVEEPVEETPVEEPVEETPVEEPVEEATEEPPPEDDGEGGGFNPSPVGWVVGGIGVAALAGSVVTGILSNNELSTLEDGCPDDACPDTPEFRDAKDSGESLALITDVLWISGAVLVTTGVVLLFVLQEDGEEDTAPDTTAGMMCGPTGCYGSVQTRF